MTVTPQTTPPLAQIRELPAGDKVTGFYLLSKCETRPKKDGTNFLVLGLQDSSGHLDAKMWDGFEEILAEAKVGDVAKVEGTIDRFRDSPSLIVYKIRLATQEEVPDRRAYFPHSELSARNARQQIQDLISTLRNPYLGELLKAIFEDPDFSGRFLETPGGKLWHHATLGGLAEHTLSLTRLADSMCSNYPELNRDLLLAGALLHDVGKVFELSAEIAIDYTSDGRLLGHIVQGTLFIEQTITRIENFPPELRKQLLHLILSHQGDGTKGSPVKPQTLEALVLHYCDELDSRVNAFRQVRAATPEGRDFSDWVTLMERFFYFKAIED